MSSGVDFREDVLNGITKSCIFGIAITQIALYMGNSAKPTPEGCPPQLLHVLSLAPLQF